MLGLSSIVSSLSRLCVTAPLQQQVSRTLWTHNTLNFRLTPALFGEPLRKKKKMDPQVIKAREERRKRKIEKQIRRLAKQAKQYKSIEELEVPLVLLDERGKRTRKVAQLSEEEEVARIELQKQWSAYSRQMYLADIKEIDRLVTSQQKALDELRLESEDLYQQAILPDEQIMLFKTRGATETPPIKKYDSPDGEYIDISQKWDN